ncbi:hypothetical protein P7K49_035529 [Saguinus oedipus]|uniref:Uncharacterized protein n=1 Tax=Saguinus oedipus TaxID=9490 RepID=A0ABQ9TMW9_SAGOE|nr:hypothetical protein P7K49_035529 [Saguinus oedipus]
MPAHRNGFPGGWRRQCPSPGDGGDPSPGLRLAGRVPGLGAQAGAELPVGGGQAKEVPCCRLAGAAAAEPPGGGGGKGGETAAFGCPKRRAQPRPPDCQPSLPPRGRGTRVREPGAARPLRLRGWAALRSPGLRLSSARRRPPPSSASQCLPISLVFVFTTAGLPIPTEGLKDTQTVPPPPTNPTSNRTTPTHKHTVAHSREHPLRNRQVDTDSLKESKRARDGTGETETRRETAIQRETQRTERMETLTDRQTDRQTDRPGDETERKVERGRPEREKVRESESQSARALEKEHSAMELGLARNRVAGPGCGRTNGALRRVFPWLGWLL